MGEGQINAFFSQNHSSRGDPWGAFGGALVGAGCVTALIAGGIIALPAMPAIATGVVIGGAIVGGGAVGAIAGAAAGALLKKPLDDLFNQSQVELKKFPGTNVPANEYLDKWIKPLGSPIVMGAELFKEAKKLDIARPGSFIKFMKIDLRPPWMR